MRRIYIRLRSYEYFFELTKATGVFQSIDWNICNCLKTGSEAREEPVFALLRHILGAEKAIGSWR